jgi:hypothetical protein
MNVAVLIAHEFELIGVAATGVDPMPRKPPTSMTT